MTASHTHSFRFHTFEFDPERLALYHDGAIVAGVTKKTLAVLKALIERPSSLVSHEEIIEQVWTDNSHGVTPNNVAQCIAELRRVLKSYGVDPAVIETVRGRGYVLHVQSELSETLVSTVPSAVLDQGMSSPISAYEIARAQKSLSWWRVLVASVGIVLGGIAAVAWFWAPGDEDEVRRVVRESQMYESLVLYKTPRALPKPLLITTGRLNWI